MTDFQSLGLSKTLLKAVASEGYTTPTPVQEQSIPHYFQAEMYLV